MSILQDVVASDVVVDEGDPATICFTSFGADLARNVSITATLLPSFGVFESPHQTIACIPREPRIPKLSEKKERGAYCMYHKYTNYAKC